jgi:tripartite-type tricarboxylate transporter receptor subunit TctC
MTVLGKRAGVEITHVAYRGGGPAMNDVIGGHVDLIAGSAALISPQLEGGKLRPILQMGRARLPLFKDTQTVIEAGFQDLETLAWWGVFAAKATPADVIASAENAIRETLKDPAAASRLEETQQMTLLLGGPKEMDAFLVKQVNFWGQVVRENGIRA